MWRKQATISVQDEFTGRALPPDLEDSLPLDLTDMFDTVRSGVKRSAEVYINLCTLLERLAKRNEGLAADHLRFSLALQSLTEMTRDTYAFDTNDVPLLNEGIKATARHLSASQSLLEDEARAWEEGMLEDLKRQRDCLVSVREMFDRRDRYARNNIPQLEKRIENSERKLQELRARTQPVKPGEIEKVEESIVKVWTFYHFGEDIVGRREMGRLTLHVTAVGQGIDCASARTWGVHQGMHPQRTYVFPTEPVSHQPASSGLEPGASEIFGAAG